MGYVLDPALPLPDELDRVVAERLGDALGSLDRVLAGDDLDVEAAVHQTRKRCKEMRGLARLVRPALGDRFRPFDRTVRAAANELSALRDAHALLGTVDALLAARPGADDHLLREVREHQAALADAATASILGTDGGESGDGDERVRRARALLAEAWEDSQRWTLEPRFDTVAAGLTGTYRRGRRELRRCLEQPTDHRMHEWRKTVKYLWYQLRLLHDASPSMLGPVVARLDEVTDALGDDHDLAVFVAQLDATPDRFGSSDAVAQARTLAREQQRRLREGALRSGHTLYAEKPAAFSARVASYWTLCSEHGPERRTGGIAALAPPDERTGGGGGAAPVDPAPFERERTFLVGQLPAELGDGTDIRQGYLALGDGASVRVRDTGDCTLTVKVGSGGAERLEFEWPISRAAFEAAWPATDGRRVTKTRHRTSVGDHVAEVDVFAGALDGLVLVEVEFASMTELAAFEAPGWFGTEVTDDRRYTNAALACDGLPDT